MEYPLSDVSLDYSDSLSTFRKDVVWLDNFVNILHELFPVRVLLKLPEFKDHADSILRHSPISRGRRMDKLNFLVHLGEDDYIDIEVCAHLQKNELSFNITAHYLFLHKNSHSYFKTVMPHICHVSSRMIHSASFFYITNDEKFYQKKIADKAYLSKKLWSTMICLPNYLQ